MPTTAIHVNNDELQVLCSALCEFINNRGPTPEAYVARRYPAEYHSNEWLAEKLADVKRRLALAEKMRSQTFEIEEI